MLTWKSYIANKALPTTKQVQIVDLKTFVIAALDINSKTFVVHVVIRKREEIPVYSKRKAQIRAQSRAQVGALIFDKAFTKVPAEYPNYSDVFLAKNVAEFPENTGINEHVIKLEKDKQLLFGPIYSLGLVELEMMKTYIETNLVNGFIRPSKSPLSIPILFDQKLDRSFCFCVDYQGLNNIAIKNRYPLFLIGELMDWLSQAKKFTQLDLINAYHQMRICESDE